MIEEIKKAKNILLHCHPSPDPDSVGSVLAMKFALEQMGKKITAIQGDSEIPEAFVFPGVDIILKKNIFETDLKEFDLFIILDSGSIEMVSAKGAIVFPEGLMTIVIDHHASNKGYAKMNHIDTSYSSTCELIYDLFTEWQIKIDHNIALNLLMGIYSDTGAFRFGNTPVKTLQSAAALATIAPDYQKIISIMENSNRKQTIIFESLALSSFMTLLNDTVGICSVSYEDLSKNNILSTDYYGGMIGNKIKSIKTVQISVTFVESEKNVVKIGFRSKDPVKYDVSKIASQLGGGGHKMAAGLTLKMSLDDAKDKVVKTIKELYTM